jgi:hypothetical protein
MTTDIEKNYEELILSLKAKSLKDERMAEDLLLDSLEARE